MELQTYNCRGCKEQFTVACESQLQEKLKNHRCPGGRKTNKKRERSKQFEQSRIALCVNDIVVNSIEQQSFNKLVEQGILIRA